MTQPEASSVIRGPVAGFLSWLVPGLGHLYIGEVQRGAVLMTAILATFWGGVAIGGVRSTVDPHGRKLWFVAQMCTGGNTLAAYGLHRVVSNSPKSSGPYLSSEVGVHFTGVAGLLNLLVIFDAIARSDRSRGKRRELVPVAQSGVGAGP